MSAAARKRVKEVLQLMTSRGWERLGAANVVVFKCGPARLNWKEAESWLVGQGLLEPKRPKG